MGERGKVRGPRAALDAAIMMAMAGVEAEVSSPCSFGR